MSSVDLSIITPLYNEQKWIKKSLQCTIAALKLTDFSAEIIILDDGSTDSSIAEVESIKDKRIRVISQVNQGRYLARKNGFAAARYNRVLFVDPKVLLNKDSLRYLESEIKAGTPGAWSGHVNVATAGNPFAIFWDTLTRIGWRRYFAKPSRTSFMSNNFDSYPKGMGMFYCEKSLLAPAMKKFEKEYGTGHFVSDDTGVLRILSEKTPINLSPEFSCTYHSRSTLNQFVKHAYKRGQNFVAGYFFPSNIFFIPLIAFYILCVGAVAALITWPFTSLLILCAGLAALFVLLPLLIRSLRILPFVKAVSFAYITPIFCIIFGAGLWRGLFRIIFSSRKA